jgi:hypothetical protein
MKPLLTSLAILGIIFVSVPQHTLAVAAVDSYGTKPQVQPDGTIDVSAGHGFVPCSGVNCSPCDLVVLFNTILKWLMVMVFLLFMILAVKAGINLVIKGTQSELIAAKRSFTNAFLGLLLMLAAWLIIDTLMKALLKDGGLGAVSSGFGPWSQVQCASQTDVSTQEGYFEGDALWEPHLTAAGDNGTVLSGPGVSGKIAGIKNTPQVTAMSDAALNANGITDPAQRKAFRALISQESSNCTNKVGPSTKYGTAYGCTQMLVSTARAMDKKMDNRFSGMTDAQVAQVLQNDNAYNIKLGAAFYKEGLQKYNGNIDSTLARYNGGDKANQPSTTCSGQTQWQCTANGGYAQTRNYVANIKAVAAGI